MIIYVTVELHQGVVGEIKTFRNSLSAKKYAARWLMAQDIKVYTDRESKSQNGTELFVRKCRLHK